MNNYLTPIDEVENLISQNKARGREIEGLREEIAYLSYALAEVTIEREQLRKKNDNQANIIEEWATLIYDLRLRVETLTTY